MEVVVVQKGAFAWLALQFQHLPRAVAMHLESPAWLHAFEHANQAVAHLIPLGNLPGLVLLGKPAGIQVDHRPPASLRLGQGRVHQFGRPFEGVDFEVFEQHPIGRQVALHTVGIRKLPQVPAKDQSVETVQNAEDKMAQSS